MSEKIRSTEPLSTEPTSYIKGGPNPERPTSNPAKRKRILLALLSELTELRDTEELEREVKGSTPASTDDIQDDSSREGVAIFRTFDRQAQSLDRKLQEFADSVRQLGSSAGLLNATYHLRGALIQIQFLFQDNAAELFTEIRRAHVETSRSSISSPGNPLDQGQAQPKRVPQRERVRERDRVHTGMRPQVKPLHNLDLFPEEMRKLARQIQVFVDRLNDIPEFTDELVNMSFSSFASDLEYRASCLAEFNGQIKTAAVQRYINDLSADIGSHMEGMQEALTAFVDIGVPYIRHAQNHTAEGLQYLSAVATFFSGVTATTLQYSFNVTGNTLADLVNALWLVSLIFSIASAINSQLAYHWRAAMYRSPRRYVPWWVAIWIKRSPLFFLIGSVIAFSIGLCVFTYSSNQGRVVSALVTAFTILTSSGLISVGLWFASERWTFSRTRGQRWLFDILSDAQDQVNKFLGITWIIQHWPENAWTRLASWTRVQIHNIKVGLMTLYAMCTCRTRSDDEEEQVHRSAFIPGQYPRPSSSRPDFDASSITENVQSAPGPGSPRFSEKFGRRLPVSDSMASISAPSSSGHVQNTTPMASGHMQNASPMARALILSTTAAASGSAIHSRAAGDGVGVVETPKPQRLKSVVERIIAMNRATGGRSPLRSRAESDILTGARRSSADNYSATSFAQKARLQGLKPGLANLQITQFLNEHMALVKHMQFSPNGDLLATCSRDRTAIIWKIGSTVELCLPLYHPVSTGGFVNQVAWSPDGESLLTRTQKAIKVWNPRTGLGQRAINRGRSIQSAAWMPSGNGFLSVEYVSQRGTESILATNLVRLASDGQVLETHKLDRIQVWDTAIMADEVRVLAVGTLLKTTDHLRPTKSRAEKRLFVYNLKSREVEHHVPMLQEVRNITLSTRTGKVAYALLSNEDKSPPQMWRLDMKKGVRVGEEVARLILVHSYFTKTPVDFADQSYFGGPNDTFVCCSSKSGDIFIWDRTSATLLHTLRPEGSEVIKRFACNHKAAPEFMLVSGTLDGALRIWSSGEPIPIAPPSEQTSPCPETQSHESTATPQRGISSGSIV